MSRFRLRLACIVTLIIGAAGGYAVTKAQQPAANDGAPGVVVEKLRPTWRVGDRWVIETRSQQIHRRNATPNPATPAPLTWRFEVAGEEQLAERPCFRLQIDCIDEGVQAPRTWLWVDRESYALRQVRTQATIAGELRTITESYEFPTGQPSPVVVAMMVLLPVDMPLFQEAETKGTKKFEFEALAGPAGVKAVDDLSFAYTVEQEVKDAPADKVKGVLHDDFAKTLNRQPFATVQLKTANRNIRQLWSADLPWPALSDNGVTVSRLVKVESPANR